MHKDRKRVSEREKESESARIQVEREPTTRGAVPLFSNVARVAQLYVNSSTSRVVAFVPPFFFVSCPILFDKYLRSFELTMIRSNYDTCSLFMNAHRALSYVLFSSSAYRSSGFAHAHTHKRTEHTYTYTQNSRCSVEAYLVGVRVRDEQLHRRIFWFEMRIDEQLREARLRHCQRHAHASTRLRSASFLYTFCLSRVCR